VDTDPDPTDTTYQVDYAVLTRDDDGAVGVHHDQHRGLFARQTWLDLDRRGRLRGHVAHGPMDRVVFVGDARPAEPALSRTVDQDRGLVRATRGRSFARLGASSRGSGRRRFPGEPSLAKAATTSASDNG
jgi:hypothetical protein